MDLSLLKADIFSQIDLLRAEGHRPHKLIISPVLLRLVLEDQAYLPGYTVGQPGLVGYYLGLEVEVDDSYYITVTPEC